MSFFVIPQGIDEYVDSIMSPRYIKVYEKNDSLQFTPKHEMMAGLTLITKTEEPKDGKILDINDLATAKELIEEGTLEVYTKIRYKSRLTTYGRERVSEIIQAHLDHIIPSGAAVTKHNIGEVYAIINKYSPETRTHMIKDLQNIALHWITEYGCTTPTLKSLANAADHEFKPMADKVMNDPTLDDKSKFLKVKEMYDSRIDVVTKNNKELARKVDESDRAKVFQLMELSVPQFLLTDKKEIVIPERPLVEGLNEREYVTHSYNNRTLLAVKSMSVPAGGYLTRQLVFLCQNLVINSEADPENYGIELPRYRCAGRTTLSGERVIEVLNKNDNDTVRVRSVIHSRPGLVSTDMFSTKYGFDVKNSRVGISMASSFTEQLTQALLGLKHGGAMATIPDDYKIDAKEDCKVVESNDIKYVLEYRGGRRMTYPSSSYIRFTDSKSPDRSYKKGERMAELVLPLPPTLKLEMVITLIGANSALNSNKMTKVDVTVAECYSIKGGRISYDFNAGKVKIGDKTYDLEDTAAYYYADGELLPPRTKFRSGIMTPGMILPNDPKPADIETAYQIFRDQIFIIMGKDSINEELMEIIFRGGLVDGKYMNVNSAITKSASVLSSISYGWASQSIAEVIREPQVITNDPMSNVLFNYMIREAAHGSNFGSEE